MKKIFFKFFLINLVTSFTSLFTVSASDSVSYPVSFTLPNPTGYYNIPDISIIKTLEQLINALASIARPVIILTFGGMILYGAWIRMTSQGNPDKVEQSMRILVAAIVGFIIIVFAPVISDFLLKLLGVNM